MVLDLTLGSCAFKPHSHHALLCNRPVSYLNICVQPNSTVNCTDVTNVAKHQVSHANLELAGLFQGVLFPSVRFPAYQSLAAFALCLKTKN